MVAVSRCAGGSKAPVWLRSARLQLLAFREKKLVQRWKGPSVAAAGSAQCGVIFAGINSPETSFGQTKPTRRSERKSKGCSRLAPSVGNSLPSQRHLQLR